ncbi:hypothetical protein Tco_1212787 [Tanacetum coccineum]
MVCMLGQIDIVVKLGGAQAATPKKILQHMKEDDITLFEIKNNLQIGISAMVIENKVKTLTITTFIVQPSKSSVPLQSGSVVNRTMSSPNRSTSDIEDAFSSMNILNYTSVSSDYFPASSGSNSFNSSENSDGNKLKTELKRIRTQIIKLQKKRLGQKDKIAFAHYRISDLEQIIEKIQARHQTDQEDL